MTRFTKARRGSALLIVLWLSAALAAIAFSVATGVRSEIEHVSTSEEDVRAYYLAAGSIDRAILHMQWSQSGSAADGSNPYFRPGQPRMFLPFPEGEVVVEVIPEASKININNAHVDLLAQLLLQLGAAPEQAQSIAAGIADWRGVSPNAGPSAFDQYYSSLQPSFRARHASIEDVEELLSIPGMTANLFYGTWVRAGQGTSSQLVPRSGFRDCVSPFGGLDRFDVNSVEPAVLAAVGVPGELIQAVVARRNTQPILRTEELAAWTQASPELASHLTIASHNIYTFRATARLRHPDGTFSDLKRSVSALVRFLRPGKQKTFQILRWYDRG